MIIHSYLFLKVKKLRKTFESCVHGSLQHNIHGVIKGGSVTGAGNLFFFAIKNEDAFLRLMLLLPNPSKKGGVQLY